KSPATAQYRPFCSRRCADVDLARWLNGSYAVPAEEEDMPEAEDAVREAGGRPERGER
ncbi:MAG: DNA gyrase inhibitor YacG, partial [Pseudomonadota bacterium]